jgi:hypothetical protein
MVIMHISYVELLCQAVMGRIPTVEYLLPGARGTYGHILACQAVNIAASQNSTLGKNYPILEAPVWNRSGREAGRADRCQNPACPRLL